MYEDIIKKYNGVDGLLEVTKNSLNAVGELLIFETSYASLNDMFDKEISEKIREEFLVRGIKIKEITNNLFHEDYTSVKDFNKKVMDIRYIDPKKLSIKVETLIYNDIVAIYEPKKDGFCIEIYSKELAEQQKQLFEAVWKIGERPIIGKGGRTSVF